MLSNETFTMRLIEWEKAKAGLRCVLNLIHDTDCNERANRAYSKFVEEFTKEIREST